MTTKEPYSYVVLRYIHDILTGEFVNVGLVMVVPGRSLILTKARKTFGRIKYVFPDLDSDSYKRAIEAIERGMKAVDRGLKSEGMFKTDRTARDYGRIALPLDDSSLQWSPVGAGLTADAQKTFDRWNAATRQALFRLFGVPGEPALRTLVEGQREAGLLDLFVTAIADPAMRRARMRARIAQISTELAEAAAEPLPPPRLVPVAPAAAPGAAAPGAAAAPRLLPVLGTPLPEGLISGVASDRM
ncbi:MAG: hypothetical protein B7Z10_07230, partial [Rhodobacterales bacterium 32-66-7]